MVADPDLQYVANWLIQMDKTSWTPSCVKGAGGPRLRNYYERCTFGNKKIIATPPLFTIMFCMNTRIMVLILDGISEHAAPVWSRSNTKQIK